MNPETNGDETPLTKAGFYEHKETGAVVELDGTPGVGTPMIDAFIKVGFVKVSEAEAKGTPASAAGEESSSDGDTYTTNTTKAGIVQYRKNGKIIKKEEYDAR